MTDFGTMMALMNLLGGMKSGGTEKGKADMSAMLPVLIGMLNANTAATGSAETAGDAPQDGMSRLLPLLMNMMKASAPSPDTASPLQDGEGADGGTRAAPRTHTYAETPFGDIGFAGTEVRTFMETLWCIRRR